MSLPTDISNHAALALQRLPEQYKGKPLISGFISAFMGTVQKIENALIQLRDQRLTLDGTTVGAQLDLLAGIVGAVRSPGDSDAVLLGKINAAIFQNNSKGTFDYLLEAVQQLIPTANLIWIGEGQPCSVWVMTDYIFPTQDQMTLVAAQLSGALSAGVRLDFIGTFDLVNPFRFGSIYGPTGFASGGFGSLYDNTVGGKFGTIEPIPSGYLITDTGETIVTEGGIPISI